VTAAPGGLVAALADYPGGGLVIRVKGAPVTQGSMNALPQRNRVTGAPVLGPGGRQVVRQVHGNAAALKPWRDAITAAAREAHGGAPPLDGPCQVDAVFSLERPAGHFRTGKFSAQLRAGAPRRPVASGKADLDKLVRAVLDALTAARVWHDDAQCAEFGRVAKVWRGEDRDALYVPGALIIVRGL
jgi:Holliday junction resolvase RusA-like endonuclease